MLGELPPEPLSLYNSDRRGTHVGAERVRRRHLEGVEALAGRRRRPARTRRSVLQPAWAQAELVGPDGARAAVVADAAGRIGSAHRIRADPVTPSDGRACAVKNPSMLVYDIAGRGIHAVPRGHRPREPAREIGSTLNPQLRFFVFDAEPNMERLVPPAPEPPLPPGPALTRRRAGDRSRVLVRARPRAVGGRAPRRGSALPIPRVASRPSPQGLADLLWAVMMKPEFQLIYYVDRSPGDQESRSKAKSS